MGSDRGLAVRRAALGLLGEVLRHRRPLDEALSGRRDLAALTSQERAFLRALLGPVLRRLGQLDDLIEAFLERPLQARQWRLQNLLRLGAAQLVFLKTPPHAAVSTTVALATEMPSRCPPRLVNAILRRLDREGVARLAAQDAEKLSTPSWLFDVWQQHYGDPVSRAICRSHWQDPPLDLRLKKGGDLPSWAKSRGGRVLGEATLRLPPGQGDVTRLPGYREGDWWVQDLAASLPVALLGPLTGLRVLELCAAPGGKTAQLATAGAEVLAVDRSAQRLKTLQSNLARLALNAELREADAARPLPGIEAEAILLDAPCSGSGTLRRHPDIGHLKGPRDVESLVATQAKLLESALAMLKPGGTLVYSVCSLQPQEGEERIEALLGGGASVERVPVTQDELAKVGLKPSDRGDLRSLPCDLADLGGLDGFFAARLRKI